MDTHQLKFILQELHFSSDMPPDVLEQLANEAALKVYSAGSVVFNEGSETHPNLYLIRNGRVALEMNAPNRGNLRILTLGPGEMIGWSALLGTGHMTASAVAVEDSEVVTVSAESLRQLCDSNQDSGHYIMRQIAAAISKRLVATRLHLLDLFADEPREITIQETNQAG